MNNPSHVIVYGAGGHAKVILDILQLTKTAVAAVVDDDPAKWGESIVGYPITDPNTQLPIISDRGIRQAVIAVGGNSTRAKIAETLIAKGFSFYTAVHPSAVIDRSVELGAGTVVMGGVVINSETTIGSHGILNTGCTVDHDCRLADFVHISPGGHLGGNVAIGRETQVGIGASILPNVTIGPQTVVGGGAAVIEDLPGGVVAVGVPARIIEK
ncbi:hypothetical protein GF373_02975 [bacterium]|nr:hypothetical protein [bacterium]